MKKHLPRRQSHKSMIKKKHLPNVEVLEKLHT